jgi:hypothetical protein
MNKVITILSVMAVMLTLSLSLGCESTPMTQEDVSTSTNEYGADLYTEY